MFNKSKAGDRFHIEYSAQPKNWSRPDVLLHVHDVQYRTLVCKLELAFQFVFIVYVFTSSV